jgi:hypothetical protein
MNSGHIKEDNVQFENGERCLICFQKTTEPYGRPGACEDCGGDFVLMSEEDKEEERRNNGQFGLSA